MQRRMLMLNASEHEIPFILAARGNGFYVITTSTKSEYKGHKYADEYVYGNYNDYDEMIKICKDYNIDAVSHACTDDCALAAAYIGEKMGYKGHDTFENACIIHRKDRFKEFCKQYGVMSPISESFSDYEHAVEYETLCTYPMIIKPSDLAGGIGISIAYNKDEYVLALKNAFERSHEKHVVVEPYIEGKLHSLTTFIVDRKVVAYANEDDHSSYNKYMTNHGIWNASDWEQVEPIIIPEVERIAEILGLVDGNLHLQYIQDKKGKPWIIEMMRRNIGNNNMFAMTNCYGINWPEWFMRAEAGMDCHNIPHVHTPRGWWGYFMVMAPHNGIYDRIDIAPEFQKYVYQQYEWEESGHEIENYLMEKMGNVLFHFETKEEKEKYENCLSDMIKVMFK